MIEEIVTRTLDFLGWRKRAYLLTFPKQEVAQNIVLKDLALYCHMNEECPHTDPFEIGVWLGKRSVFLRVQRHLYLTPEELFAIYGGVRPQKETRVA